MLDHSTFPPSTRAVIAGYAATPITDGESGGAVYRLEGDGLASCHLQHGRHDVAEAISREATRLGWLAGRIAVPRLVHFERSADAAWLVTTTLPGRSAYALLEEHPRERLAIASAVATFLRALHAIPLADCPFHAGEELRLSEARRRLDAGVVDASDFDEARAGWSATQVWETMVALRPAQATRVVTHGDYSLDNVCLDAGRVTGCLDVERLGAGDPYQDVAICWRDLGAFGAEVQRAFLQAYGISSPDPQRLEFYLCLDEFF